MPLVVNENGSLLFFASAGDAERYLEPVDVRNGEYAAFDAEGRRLELAVEEEGVRALFGLVHARREQVRVAPAESRPSGAQELRAVLLRFLQRTGHAPPGAAALELDQLVSRAAAVGGMS